MTHGNEVSTDTPRARQEAPNGEKDQGDDEISSAPPLSPLAKVLIAVFQREHEEDVGQKISVNPVVSKFATWYEKFRNAMEYREDEVILRATIERILKRRLLLGGNAETTAGPLVRELIWARYLPEDAVGTKTVEKVEKIISLYLQLRLSILKKHNFSESTINKWTYQLMSSDIEKAINPHTEVEAIGNFMFQIMKDRVVLEDDSEDTKNAQVYIVIRKAFARDDVAFLRFHMFQQLFGTLSEERLEKIAEEFPKGYKEITRQLEYPRKDRIYNYIKKHTAAYLILEDVLHSHKASSDTFLQNLSGLHEAVREACKKHYDGIAAKVQRAIIRSVLFIFLTKLLFAFLIEGTYENVVYGEVLWGSIALNTGIPPLLMIIVGVIIKTPGKSNTERIYNYIQEILYKETPSTGESLVLSKKEERGHPVLNKIFAVLWLLAFIVSFGSIIFILIMLQFNFVSQGIFLFFLAIVSFLSYRISLVANLYRLGEKQGIFTPLIDFLFMPIIRVGRKLTEGISQVNFFLFLFDFFIEVPFKGLFAFFEQWFHFLHTKRDNLG